MSSDSDRSNRRHIAIIGGGIGGLYAAWRLRELPVEADITIYESTGAVGGRIKTTDFGISQKDSTEPPLEMCAELGAMRFPKQHLLLVNLCKELGIDDDVTRKDKPSAWLGPFELTSLYHLRGQTLSDVDFQRGNIPYQVTQEERFKTPAALLEYAIFRMFEEMIGDYQKTQDIRKAKQLKDFRDRLKANESLNAADWMTFITEDFEFGGIPLRNIGFWNVLKHFLSSEAFLLVHDGFGFLSVISNWNAPEAFKWLLTDFSPHQRLHTLKNGLSQLTKKLALLLSHKAVLINTDRHLRAIQRTESKFVLTFDKGSSANADVVILALPPNALRKVSVLDDDLSFDERKHWKELIACSHSHRLAKIVLAYEEPWWKHTTLPGAESGRVFTDLPMRQIYYFGPRWLAENGWTKKQSPQSPFSLIMAYNDSHYEAFWRTFHMHDKVYSSEIPIEKRLGYLPHEIIDGPFAFLGPREFALKDTSNSRPTEADPLQVRHRMEEKVRRQLQELHRYEVPMAIGGVYKDWSDEGGWHTWEPFVDVPTIKEIILQPFASRSQQIVVRPCGEKNEDVSDRLNLYVCGEAYAWEQGWIEGALMTAERVAKMLAAGKYEKPFWFQDTKEEFELYMHAEFERPKPDTTAAADLAETMAR